MTSVFISYARTDQVFVRRLHSALAAAGRDAWVDWEDIPPSAQWRSEIESGIAAADTVICVISPDWAASATSQQEVATALADRKRIIPLVYREVPSAEVDAGVRALNWIFFRESDDFDAAFQKLLFALDTDLDYWHLSSRLLVRARQWESGKENSSFVLRGRELAEAERWLGEGADKQPTPTALQTRFITSSRRASGRRQRTWIGLLSAGLIIAIVLGTYARVEQSVADQRSELLFTQVLAGDSSIDLTNNNIGQALLLGVAATRRLPDTEQSRNALVNALEYSPHLAASLNTVTEGSTSAGQGVAVAFSADGKTMMTANQADPQSHGHVILWDAATHLQRRQIDTGDVLVDAALSPDGHLVAVNGALNGLTVWDASTGTKLLTLAPSTEVAPDKSLNTAFFDVAAHGMVFTPDGSLLAARQCDDFQCAHPFIGLWNPQSGSSLGHLPLDFSPMFLSLALSPDGKRLAATECALQAGAIACQIDMFDLASQTRLYTHPITPADGGGYQTDDVAFAPDGSSLLTSGCPDIDCTKGQILIWDVATGSRTASAWDVGPGLTLRFAISPDGRTLVASRPGGMLALWDTATHQLNDASLAGHVGNINDLAFSPDGRTFASAGEDGHMLLWHLGAFTPFSLAPSANLDGSSQVAISPNGAMLATASCDGKVRLWDRTTGALHSTLGIPDFTEAFCLPSLAFSKDGQFLVAGTNLGPLLVWNTTTGEIVSSCLSCAEGTVQRVAFSPDGKVIMAVDEADSGSTVELVTTATGDVIHTFDSPTNFATVGAAFSPDGTLLALGGSGPDTYGITVWNITSAQTVATLAGNSDVVGALAFSPVGRVLASEDNHGNAALWDMATGKRLANFGDARAGATEIGLSFSPSGQQLAIATGTHLSLWDVRDLQHPALYVRPFVESDEVLNVIFSPNGQLLIDAIHHGPVNVRYATHAGWQQPACAVAGRNFTRAEWATFTTTQTEPYPTVCPALPVQNV